MTIVHLTGGEHRANRPAQGVRGGIQVKPSFTATEKHFIMAQCRTTEQGNSPNL
jgi:hypothetical protein